MSGAAGPDRALSATVGGGMVDSLLREIAEHLQRFVAKGDAGGVDLRSLPLTVPDLSELKSRLGAGGVTAEVQAFGLSTVRETSFPGVWWVTHFNEAGEVIADLVEICAVPAIVQAPQEDAAAGLARLQRALTFDRHQPGTPVGERIP